ncbi:MAG: 3-oxoadipate enol-lactonase [Actinomycetota bacterium]|nr:3-oxoadipate enol-lactonase [Actinomycetota bacterium]
MSARLRHDIHGSESAPVLVLAPSVGTLPEMWDPQLAAFAREFRVVRIAHRGHDEIDVPPGPYSLDDLGGDVLALLDSLGVDRFSWCGLSLGGMVGMWLAAHAPERVDRLAVCCTSAHLPPAQGWLDRAAKVRASGMSAVADAVVPRWFTPEFLAKRPGAVDRCRSMLLSVPAEGYAGCCEAIAAMDLRPLLASIQAPTLVLAGAQDLPTPLPHAETITSLVPGATLVVVEDAAHLATVQQPERCTEVLLNHLLDRPGGAA